jgi:hypothetical protein
VNQREVVSVLNRLVWFQVSRYIATRPHLEGWQWDMYQEALAQVFTSLPKFNPARGSLSGFAYRYIQRGIQIVAFCQTGSFSAFRGPQGWLERPEMVNTDGNTESLPASEDGPSEAIGVTDATREALLSVPVSAKAATHWARNVELFLEHKSGETFDALSKRYGMSTSGAKRVVRSVEPAFVEWASCVRREAA